MAIFQEWIIKTRAVMNRSAPLLKVDASVNKVVLNGFGPKDANILQLWADFQAWKKARMDEYNKITTAADALQNELAAKYNAVKTQLAGTLATQVKPIGWTYKPFDSVLYSFALPEVATTDRVPALTPAEIQRINESMRRVKLAVEGARSALLTVAKRQNFKSPMPLEEGTYTDYFGAYGDARFVKVLENFRALQIAFEKGPDIVDLRNTDWKDVYGACLRKNMIVKQKGQLSLSGKVNMFLGRAFLKGGSYSATSSNTIGTLVHEFSHGAANTVDVPPVDDTGNFIHDRKSDDPTHPDFGDSTDNAIQASTPERDKDLAKHKPEYACVNADCYGEFARQILVAKAG